MTSDDPFSSVHRASGRRRALVIVSVVVAAGGVVAGVLSGLGNTHPTPEAVTQVGAESTPAASADHGSTVAPTSVAGPVEQLVEPSAPPASANPKPSRYPHSGMATATPEELVNNHFEPFNSQWGRIYLRTDTVLRNPRVDDCLLPSGHWSSAGVEYSSADCVSGVMKVVATVPFTDAPFESSAKSRAKLDELSGVVWDKCFSRSGAASNADVFAEYDDASNLLHWDLISATDLWVVEPAPGVLVCMRLVQ